MFTPSLAVLWLLPALQLGLFGFFFADAMTGTLWYDDGVLCLCCAAGLAGGAVYVHGFKLISSAMPTETRELAMASASVSADIGIGLASVASLFIQACIYRRHAIDGTDDDVAIATAPFCRPTGGGGS